MGYYINAVSGVPLPRKGKADAILAAVPGSSEIPVPQGFKEDLVCVVDNFIFDAAGYAFSPEEFKVFAMDGSGRPKRWLIVPGAPELSNFK